MADRKPPRLCADERATLTGLLQYQRESLVRKVTGVDEDAAHRALVGSGTTLVWLVRHLARAEVSWVVVRFAGEPAELPGDEDERDVTLADAVALYRSTWPSVDAVIAAADLDEPAREVGAESTVNLRFVLTHLLEETARHAGHADILRELIDGETGR